FLRLSGPFNLVTLHVVAESYGAARDLRSFPTRRSSDLAWRRSRSSPVRRRASAPPASRPSAAPPIRSSRSTARTATATRSCGARSEEHTSELQSRENRVCRLLLEKKKSA